MFERFVSRRDDLVRAFLGAMSALCRGAFGKEKIITKVSSEVLPDPLGPVRRKVGKVVEVEERYMNRWRKRGMESTISAVTMIANGVGSSRDKRKDRESSIASFVEMKARG